MFYNVIKYYLVFYNSNTRCDRLVQRLACLTNDHEVMGSIPGTSTSFKCGLGLERGPPSLVRTIGQLLDGEVADLIKKVDIIRLDRG